jgi:hypothetical protein
VVYFESVELLIWSVDVQEKAAERDENVAMHTSSVHVISTLLLLTVHVVAMSFLKSIDLAMAYVVILVRQCLLAHSDFSPALGIVFASIEIQREGQS